jgi:CubicO group peptidase (beta-lactamase class C family)
VVRCAGLASIEHGVPIIADTVFHAASLAKQFTATAVHLLAVNGRLSLEDPIRLFIPELPECCRSIRLRHLLHHTSGLRDQWDLLFLAGWRPEDVVTTEDVLALLQRQTGLNFPPGEEHLYCNTGYTLLALAVERVAGQPLNDFCQERLFAPTQMSNTRFQHDHAVIVPKRASSYTAHADGSFRSSALSFSLVGATNLLTTVGDLALWERAVHAGILSDWGLADAVYAAGILTDGSSTSYGAGLRISRYAEGLVAYHSGVDAGFRCHFIRFPSDGLSVAILGNVSNLYPAELARQASGLDWFGTPPGEARTPPGLPSVDVAGAYWSEESGLGCQVERVGDRLFFRGYGFYPMVAETEWDFRLKGYPEARLSFTAENGTVRLLEQTPGCRSVSYVRTSCLQKAGLPAPQVYAGVYTCGKINSEYRVLADGEELRVLSLKHRSAPLIWVGRDRCICFWNKHGGAPHWVCSVRFERDLAERVRGFSLSTHRTRALFFHRVETDPLPSS